MPRANTPPRPRRAALSSWAIALALGACGGPETEPGGAGEAGRARAIVVFDVDTLRADHLGCYGYARDTSPELDRLAGESALFEHAFSQAPNTPPSQSSILTSLYPSSHGMIRGEDRLSERAVTLAEVLRDAGWTTAAFVDGGYLSPEFGLDQGFELYDDSRRAGLEVIGPKVLEWLRRPPAEPFLLFVHTYDVHAPYRPPEPYASLFTDGLEPPSPGFEPTGGRLREVNRSLRGPEPRPLEPRDLAFAVARYDGGIRYVDSWLGRLLEALRSGGLLERAVFVVVSDHGEAFQEHGFLLHEQLYAPVTHVPLLLRLPGGARAGRIPAVVETVDLMPTLLELVGVEAPAGLQGESLLPLLRGERSPPGVAFGESPFFGGTDFVARGDWRLIHRERKGESELYRYRDDPLEQRDLAAERPAEVEGLRGLIARWREAVEAARLGEGEAAEVDEATREQLEALGYL